MLKDKDSYKVCSYKECEKWIDTVVDYKEVIVDKQVRELLVNWINEILNNKKNSLVKSIFNKDINIDEVKLKFINEEDVKVNLEDISVECNVYDIDLIFEGEMYKKRVFLTNLCYYILFYHYRKNGYGNDEPLFLPASRTGFMLTYKTLINESIKNSFGNEKIQRSKFTAPIINFLNKFVDLNVGINGQYFDIVKFIEKELLKGNIVKDESPVKNIYYKPDNLNDTLPLYLTSSLVTEVAPLVLFLSDVNSDFRTLIIEEPESHLHLKAQIAMARVVVRLVNSGLNVWLTTHSDTFMQQINNLLKLNVHKDKAELLKKLNLEKQDCLDISNVRVYEFNTSEGKTTVTAIKNSETGFPLPTFNDVISKLTDEVMILEDEEDD